MNLNFINIIGTLFDNSLNHISAIANQVFDLKLNKRLELINEELYSVIPLEASELNKLVDRLFLENRFPKHVFLTQELYDSLNGVYDKNTLYFIVESVEEEIGYVFGDLLPIKLGWTFGRKFPITLS